MRLISSVNVMTSLAFGTPLRCGELRLFVSFLVLVTFLGNRNMVVKVFQIENYFEGFRRASIDAVG